MVRRSISATALLSIRPDILRSAPVAQRNAVRPQEDHIGRRYARQQPTLLQGIATLARRDLEDHLSRSTRTQVLVHRSTLHAGHSADQEVSELFTTRCEMLHLVSISFTLVGPSKTVGANVARQIRRDERDRSAELQIRAFLEGGRGCQRTSRSPRTFRGEGCERVAISSARFDDRGN